MYDTNAKRLVNIHRQLSELTSRRNQFSVTTRSNLVVQHPTWLRHEDNPKLTHVLKDD